MESTNNIQNQNLKNIFHIFSTTINEIYKEYCYLKLSESEYQKLVSGIISDLNKTLLNDPKVCSNYLKVEITKALKVLVKDKLEDTSKSLDIIQDYINSKFHTMNTYKDAICYFKILNEFFEEYNYIPNPDLISDLLTKNSCFNKMIELIFQEHQSLIVSGNLEKTFDIPLLILATDLYCMLNGIVILDDDQSQLSEEEQNYEDLSKIDTEDVMKRYMIEVNRIPLLTAEEVKQLAIRVAAGDEAARKTFIESNLRLVVKIARKYRNRGISLSDLIQEGSIGLMTAVDCYDVTKGFKFSTYAFWWIRQAITRALANNGKMIRIPVGMYNLLLKYNKVVNNLELQLHRPPTPEEIAEEMQISLSKVAVLQSHKTDAESINKIIDDDGTELEYFISSSEDLETDVIDSFLPETIEKLLEECQLDEREKGVLIKRFGLDGNGEMTLDDVGIIYGISRERTRQIEAAALKKIRRFKKINDFAIYTQHPDQSIKNIQDYRRVYRDADKDHKYYINPVKQRNYIRKTDKTRSSKKMQKKYKTIYDYLGYPKEEVDAAISRLPEEHIKIVHAIYGGDLDNPKLSTASKYENSRFYSNIVPMLKRLLIDPNYAPKIRKRKEPLQLEKAEVEKPSNPDIIPSKVELPTNQKVTKEDCLKMLDLLRTPTFIQMMGTLTAKEAVIISLRLGYIDGKYFSTKSIANFLGMEEQEVIECSKKVLLLYKDNLNSFLDEIINLATDQASLKRVLPESSDR